MKTICYLIVGAFLILCMSCASAGSTSPSYAKARVYLFHWEVISNRVRSIDETRQTHSEYVELSDQSLVGDFVKWLKLDAMTPSGVTTAHNALLVIDLIDSTGATTTYYSDGCYLYSSDSKNSRPIDIDFRRQFDFYGDEMVIHAADKTYHLCGG